MRLPADWGSDDCSPPAVRVVIPTIPKDLTAEQATDLLSEIWASALPDSVKVKLAQQVDYRLAEAAGNHQQPQSVSAGVSFNGASPDEVMRGLKKLAEQR